MNIIFLCDAVYITSHTLAARIFSREISRTLISHGEATPPGFPTHKPINGYPYHYHRYFSYPLDLGICDGCMASRVPRLTSCVLCCSLCDGQSLAVHGQAFPRGHRTRDRAADGAGLTLRQLRRQATSVLIACDHHHNRHIANLHSSSMGRATACPSGNPHTAGGSRKPNPAAAAAAAAGCSPSLAATPQTNPVASVAGTTTTTSEPLLSKWLAPSTPSASTGLASSGMAGSEPARAHRHAQATPKFTRVGAAAGELSAHRGGDGGVAAVESDRAWVAVRPSSQPRPATVTTRGRCRGGVGLPPPRRAG
jgi:hypothetical protein